MVISVDTGNKMIKTEHYEFNSGIDVLDTIPGENDEVIEFGGKYYRTTNRRISYMEDKTEDDRYYILTLIAIAKELDTMKKEAVLAPNELIEIELLVGLPPAHYIPQLQNRYPDNQWEEILGGCDFSIFLGCNDMTTATYYSDRIGEITVSVASIRKNFFTIRATDYVPEYSESRSIGKRQLLLPDEILRYPLDQGILIIRGHNVLRFKKMDYTEHADAGKLKMEKVVDHIPDWYQKWQKQQQELQISDEQVYEASDPLEKKESPIKENDVQEPLTVNGTVQKQKNKKRAVNSNTVMKVDDLFVKKSKG